MNAIIILMLSMPVIMLYSNLKKNKAFSEWIESITLFGYNIIIF